MAEMGGTHGNWQRQVQPAAQHEADATAHPHECAQHTACPQRRRHAPEALALWISKQVARNWKGFSAFHLQWHGATSKGLKRAVIG